MATVTGFTAARMLEIENATVVDGNVVGDNLILVTHGGTEIDAGDVRGPIGATGPPGPLTQADADTRYVNVTGDTMTGPLLVPTTPTVAAHAASKSYVDSSRVAKAGDTMTGTLILPVVNITGSGEASAGFPITAPFLIGPNTAAGFKLVMDRNEIQAIDGEIGSSLTINQSGGPVICGESVSAGTPDPSSSESGVILDERGFLVSSIIALDGTANASLCRVTNPAAAVGQPYIRFGRLSTNTEIGSVTIASTSSVAFNTTSDPRLKEQLGPIEDASTRVQALAAKAFRGRWLSDQGQGDVWDMISSHDIEDAASYAVHGERDATDQEGEVVAQQVDFSALVPLLISALGDALDRIAVLEGTSQ